LQSKFQVQFTCAEYFCKMFVLKYHRSKAVCNPSVTVRWRTAL